MNSALRRFAVMIIGHRHMPVGHAKAKAETDAKLAAIKGWPS
jgi:hypothetical protein